MSNLRYLIMSCAAVSALDVAASNLPNMIGSAVGTGVATACFLRVYMRQSEIDKKYEVLEKDYKKEKLADNKDSDNSEKVTREYDKRKEKLADEGVSNALGGLFVTPYVSFFMGVAARYATAGTMQRFGYSYNQLPVSFLAKLWLVALSSVLAKVVQKQVVPRMYEKNSKGEYRLKDGYKEMIDGLKDYGVPLVAVYAASCVYLGQNAKLQSLPLLSSMY